MSGLAGKVALVTGASKGIGAAIAKELAARGAAVAVNYAKSKDAAEQVVAEIVAAGGRAIAVQADIADPAAIPAMVKNAADTLGPIDILVNNAGIYRFAPVEQITLEHIESQLRLNVTGLLLTTKEALARFQPRGGCIINIGSIAGQMATAEAVAYSATKGAVDSITVSLSKELGPRGIRVNALNPGPVLTETTRAGGVETNDFGRMAVAATPLGRLGVPQDVAAAAAFLASDDARWISGQLLFASGGLRL